MKLRVLNWVVLGFAFVLISYGTTNAQVIEVVKKAADKTKDVTVDATKKTVEVTKDIAGETKEVTVEGAEETADVAEDVYDKSEDGVSKSAEVVGDTFEDDGIAEDVLKATANGTKNAVWYAGDKSADLGKLGYKASKSVVMTTWDGTKWVAKKSYLFIKGDPEDQ